MTRHDPLIETAREAAAADARKGTGPRKSPKSFHEVEDADEAAPEKSTLSMARSPRDGLPDVLLAVAELFEDDHSRPLTAGNFAYALRRIARKLGEDRS